MKKIREALELLPDNFEGWWCPECKSEVDATYYEQCNTCGFPLSDCQPSDNTAKVKEEALAELAQIEERLESEELVRKVAYEIANTHIIDKELSDLPYAEEYVKEAKAAINTISKQLKGG